MVKKIFKNTFLTSLVAVLLSVFLILFIFYEHYESQMMKNIKEEANLLANGLKHVGADYFKDFKPSDGIRITWVNRDGSVLYDSEADIEKLENHGERDEIKEALKNGESEIVRYSDTSSKRTVYYAKLLQDGTVIRMSYGYNMVADVLKTMLQPVLIVIFLLGGIMYLVAKYTAKAIVSPINDINLEEGKMEEGVSYVELKPLLSRIRRQNLQIDTNIRKLKREYENQENFRREFTANVSHELKTPLTSISGISEMMMNGIIKEEDIAGFAKNINKEAGRLINLVNDIILITELEGNDSYLQKEQINVVELVLSVAKRLEIPAKKRNVSIEVTAINKKGKRMEKLSFDDINNGDNIDNADKKLPDISINAVYSMIEELVVNLSDNAIKYNKENGNVYIYVQDEDNNIKIIVEDTGIGIPKHDKTRVFQRFYRVDKSRSKEVGGTGLGLSIVKHVALYHGGKVYAEDRAGGGTRMVAKLPK